MYVLSSPRRPPTKLSLICFPYSTARFSGHHLLPSPGRELSFTVFDKFSSLHCDSHGAASVQGHHILTLMQPIIVHRLYSSTKHEWHVGMMATMESIVGEDPNHTVYEA
ncbi:ABC transporter B family member 2 [Sesbania bispinosa]|nr:ABC transporter B family member 2 [Sesbania bispinosa]